ncbi:hypothetical protein M758_3G213300 [Ceratodon purpureus]|nr:hypothetical protein M758_3G213300 [Ceratodon purpureus]
MDGGLAEEVLCHKCGGKHAGPCSIQKIMAALSLSLSQGFEGATRWSISDTTAGLLKLYKRHNKEDASDTITGVRLDPKRNLDHRAELEEMLEWLRWSIAAYEKDRPTLLASMQLRDQDVKQMVTKSLINKPAYLIAVYHARKYVVMGIRGTYNTTDILTDLNPHNEPFLEGAAHSGMLGAAKWLLDKEGPLLKRLLLENPGYMLALTGHSLGGAVAALMTMLIRDTARSWIFPIPTPFMTTSLGIKPSGVKCWGFGTAPCVDRRLAEGMTFIRNVVLQDDVVPRVNPAAIEALREEIQDTTFRQSMKPDGKTKKVVETIDRIKVSNLMQSAQEVGSTVYQKLQEARLEHGCPLLSCSSANKINSRKMMIEDKSISNSNMDDPETDAGIAAKAIMSIARGPSVSRQELEKRRLFVPGVLYHIRRQKIKREERMTALPAPARPYDPETEAPRGSKYKHYVICGTDPSSRFGRIILSSTLLSDHGCFNIRDGILDALQRKK